MSKLKQFWKQASLTFAFALFVFLIILISSALIFVGIYLLDYFGLSENPEQNRMPLFFFALVSLIVGTLFAVIFSKLPLKPIRKVMDAADKIANGDYSVRLPEKGTTDFKDLNRKFNHMAEELQSVEMLRSDFIGNFSHEFKTPIVSIRGFAKALKWDDLTNEERNEYLDIIIAESERLSELSTNVLMLSKIEQQTILTDKKRFNLSEQLRLCIAMLDGKWADKHITFIFDSDEIYINGNEELLKQVWINLLDNAIKFSPDNSVVTIEITKIEGKCFISIMNKGDALSDEQVAHIFDKFYQGDISHATKGNGLGLTIAKRIVELHKGIVKVECKNENVIVTVIL